MIGERIKMGRPGIKPTITRVVWAGTAEVNMYQRARVPAALVETDGDVYAIVRLAGCKLERDAWWDARCVSTREWETESGDLVGHVDPVVTADIEAVLKTGDYSPTGRHEFARKELDTRIRMGTYAVA